MKHLLTLAALLVSTLSLAQQMPYNPDANGDDFVGVDDVLGVLGVYDTALMQPDLTCDYEGTDLEQLFIGLADNSLTLDSVYIEYLIYDTLEYFTPGCPDVVVEPVVLERSYMMYSYGQQSWVETVYFGFYRFLEFSYNEGGNSFGLYVYDAEVDMATTYASNGYLTSLTTEPDFCEGVDFTLPFPDSMALTEDGIQGAFCNWPGFAENFKVIPFWH